MRTTKKVVWNKGKKLTEEQKKNMYGHIFSKSHLQKLRDAKIGKKWSNERKLTHKGMLGKHHSEETRKKISQSHLGKHYPKLSESMKGRVYSKEHNLKIGLSNKGKIRSDEYKKKLSVTMKNTLINHPERHPYRILAKNGHISFPQKQLQELIKKKIFYPLTVESEYPIHIPGYGVRYADIAIPQIKIDIEYDGKEWHTNKERDCERDKQLLKCGWATFRFEKCGGEFCLKNACYPKQINEVDL